jgi:hypothetical protein
MEYPPLKNLSSYILYKELKEFLEEDCYLKTPDEITKKILIWNYVNQYSDFYLLGSEHFFSDILNEHKEHLDWTLISKEVNKTINIDCVLDNINLPWKPEHFYIKNK